MADGQAERPQWGGIPWDWLYLQAAEKGSLLSAGPSWSSQVGILPQRMPLPKMGQPVRVLSKNLVASVCLSAVFERCETLWGLACVGFTVGSSVGFTERVDLKLFLS